MLFLRPLLPLLALALAAPELRALPFLPHHREALAGSLNERDPDVDGTMPEDYLPVLKQLVDEAGRQSPGLIAHALEIDIANAEKLYNGIAPMLPSVNGWVQYGQNQSQVANNSTANSRSKGFFYDAQAHQPVFHWGQLRDRLNQSRIVVAISERNYATAYEQFVQQVRSQYLGLIAAKMDVRTRHFTLRIRQRNLDYVLQQRKAGAATLGTEQGARLDEADAQLAADQADEDFAFAKRALAREVGRKEIGEGDIPDAVPAPRFSSAAASELLAEVMRTGARYLPDSQVALLQIRNSQLEYNVWKVNLLPMVGLGSEVSQTTNNNATANSITSTAITSENVYMRADWNIFDGLYTRGRKQEALLRRRQAERELKLKADAAMDGAQQAEHRVEFAWRALQLAVERAEIARAALTVARQEHASGAGSEEAVAGVQMNDYNYEYLLAVARGAFLSAWSDFVGTTGHDPALNQLPARYVRPVS